ncbi:MAG TPA: DNA polymerase III subunit delta' [Acetobacteraceae bacterium]|jgi:DNA polymerase-3 subunit delta'
MTVPAPRANPDLRGHAATEAMLAEAMRSGRMHHAWLITGPAGIGKATLAFRFAGRLLAGMPGGTTLALAPDHPTFRRVAAGTHADLLTVEREWDPKRKRLRGEIVVDDVRRVADLLRRTPAEGGWRVVVLDGAEDLNRNAANALLKMLEEPPPRAILLLVCSAAGRLLPTIRSRCRRLALAPLGSADIAALLGQYMPELSRDDAGRLAALAEGSVGRALQLAEGGGAAYADMVSGVLDGLGVLSVDRAHALADVLGRNEDGFSTFMDLLRAAVASAVRDAARGRPDPDQARMIGTRPLDAWIDVWHALTRLQDETENAYLDKRQALVTGLGMLARTN